MLRWRGIEISSGALLLGAILYYLDDQGILFPALLACALHEIGHYLAVRQLGGRIVRLRITCIGAEMRLSSRYALSAARLAVVDLSGPAANLLAAWLAAGVRIEAVWCFAGVNLALGLFNLLPVAPLDGGRALGRLLSVLLGEGAGRRCIQALSIAFSLGLMAAPLLLLYRGGLNLTLFLTALWMLWGGGAGKEEGNMPAFR